MERLCYEYEVRNENKGRLKHKHEKAYDPETGQELFKPLIGRGPAVLRQNVMPVHDFLHAHSQHAEQQREQLQRMQDDDSRRHASMSHVSEGSQLLLGSMKAKSYSEVFRALLASVDLKLHAHGQPGSSLYADDERWSTALLDVALASPEQLSHPEVASIVRDALDAAPAGAFEHANTISFETFCDLVDEALRRDQQRHGPRASALLRRQPTRELQLGPDPSEECTFAPEIDPLSRELAEKAGRTHTRRIEDVLLEENLKYHRAVEEKRSIRAEEELSQCTFTPEITAAARQLQDARYPLVGKAALDESPPLTTAIPREV